MLTIVMVFIFRAIGLVVWVFTRKKYDRWKHSHKIHHILLRKITLVKYIIDYTIEASPEAFLYPYVVLIPVLVSIPTKPSTQH